MYVFATCGVDQVRGGPHADAPGIAGVWIAADLVVPLPILLPCDLPEVALSPLHRLAAVIEKLRAAAVGFVVVAFEVAVARPLPWTNLNLRGRRAVRVLWAAAFEIEDHDQAPK